MRSFIVLAMFTASLSHAAWSDYTENRNLEIDADGIDVLEVDTGAGSLEITSDASADAVRVTATINVHDVSDEKARKIIESDMRLTLEKQGDTAVLRAYFDNGSWFFGAEASIDVQVTVPQDMDLRIDDGSGSILVDAVGADVTIDDGSGSISVAHAQSVEIDDGSGSIKVMNISGDVAVEDGSGEIVIRGVGGAVTIDDGSGSIDVDDVESDLTIIDDGSGSVRLSDVRGQIRQPN